MDGSIKSLDQLLALAEHFLTADIDKGCACFLSASFSQHGDADAERPPHHHPGRDTKLMLLDHFRLLQRQTDHLFENLFDLSKATDIIPIQLRIANLVKNIF